MGSSPVPPGWSDCTDGLDGVTAEIDENGRRSEIWLAWVVGCDGFRSSVRDLAALTSSEQRSSHRGLCSMLRLRGGHEKSTTSTFAHLDLPTVILTPLPGRRWRVYVRPESDASDLVGEATDVVRRYDPKVTFTDIENPVRFRCHSPRGVTDSRSVTCSWPVTPPMSARRPKATA